MPRLPPPKTELHPAPKRWRTRPTRQLDSAFENSRPMVHGIGRALPVFSMLVLLATGWCVYLALFSV